MVIRCSWCERPAEDRHFLCLEIEPYTNVPRFICRECVAWRVDLRDQAQALEDDAQDRADHLASCDYCYRNKGLIPPALLFQMCVERRGKAVA